MATEYNENQDTRTPKEVAVRLRQHESVVVSPIDLSLERAQSLRAEQLQWLNFYEPPIKLTLSNSGDTVMVRGQWPNRQLRPTLSGGTLDGHYVFSQAHFHWDSSAHTHSTHTINGYSKVLEMHSLFYKSSYRNQAQAQEKEDGIVIVVYFFEVEEQSSFSWVTDQLSEVSVPRCATSLPPAPLCALMVPFTRDYLAYWGALACTCHHVLWLVSRTPLRITRDELELFGKVQCNTKENVKKEDIKIVKNADNIYQINSSKEILDVLLPDSTDPPCKISAKPSKITIAVEYQKMMTLNQIENVSGGELIQETCFDVCRENHTCEQEDSSESGSDSKVNCSKSNPHHHCRMCKNPTDHLNRTKKCVHKIQRKRQVPKRYLVEKEKVTNSGKVKMLERVNKSSEEEFLKQENEAAKVLIEKEKEEIETLKKALDDEMKRLEDKHKVEYTQQAPDDDINETENTTRKLSTKGAIQKSVFTTKSKSDFVNEIDLRDENENIDIKSSRCNPGGGQQGSPINDQSYACGDPILTKEEADVEIKIDKPPSKLPSKLPVRKFSPWKPQEGLKSSLTPYFSGCRSRSLSEKRPDSPTNNLKISSQIPKFDKRIVNRTKRSQRVDLSEKGGQQEKSAKTLHSKVSINYL